MDKAEEAKNLIPVEMRISPIVFFDLEYIAFCLDRVVAGFDTTLTPREGLYQNENGDE